MSTPLSVPDAIRQRRSQRHFQDKPISDELLAELLELTTAAPSSWNFQPWRIVLIRDEERRKQLSAACWNQPQPLEAPVSFIFAISHSGWRDTMDDVISMAESLGAWAPEHAGMIRQAAPGFQEALGDGLREYNTKDALIAATHLALAAESLGLASAYMNGYLEDKVKALIGAEGNDDIGVSLVMPVGYAADGDKKNPGRLPLNRTVFDETIDQPWGA